MEKHIIKMVEEHEKRIKSVEEASIRTTEQLKTINDKLDAILKKDNMYVRKDICELSNTQLKEDINNVGKIARSALDEIDIINKADKSKTEKYFQYAINILISLYIIGSTTKII